MKKTLVCVLCLLLSLSLCACGETQAPQAAPEPVAEETAVPESIAEEIAAPEAAAEEAPSEKDWAPDIRFSAESMDGATWTDSCFADAKLTMVNFWEPWCGPCVQELPELAALYNDYRDKGVQIIGVFDTTEMREDAESLIQEAGVEYPVLFYVSAFEPLQSGYVPTTVFFDSEGHLVGQMEVGSHDYAGWAAILEALL